jgi:hypothetical protein
LDSGEKATEKPDQTPWSRPRVTDLVEKPAVVRREVIRLARAGEPMLGY